MYLKYIITKYIKDSNNSILKIFKNKKIFIVKYKIID